mgnify:CR=1 FL=1
MHILLSPSFASKKYSQDIAVETISTYNEINFNKSISKFVDQCIDQETFKKISGMFLKSKDIVKDINPQVAFNFLSGERLKILEEPKAGSFVYVVPNKEEIFKFQNQKKHFCLVLEVFQGNKNIAHLAPVTYNINNATDKSLIINGHNSQKIQFAIQLEFSFLTFLDDVELTDTLPISKKLVRKINHFQSTNNPDYKEFTIGIPNFHFMDYRIEQRNSFAREFAAISSKAQYFLDYEYSEVVDEEKEPFFQTSNMFDLIYLPQNISIKEQPYFNEKKVFNSVDRLRDISYA